MNKTGVYFICLALLLSVDINNVAGAAEYKPTGDLRAGYFSKDDTKNGEDSEGRVRLRAGVKANFNDKFSAKFRLAGRFYIKGDNDWGFDYLDSTPPYKDSIPAGQATIDTFFFKYSFAKNSFIRLGRFQSKYELAGVAKKSLDRNNSPNTDINWTDGVHLSMALSNTHQLNAIVQYNPEDGTAVLRKPLSFTDSKSRVSYFLGIQHTKTSGPLVQREIDITVMPSALCKSGVDSPSTGCQSGSTSTYVAGVARVAAQWPIVNSASKFLLGTALGYAPTKPEEKAAGGDATSTADASGLAYQLTFNFLDILPKHSLGFVYGRAGGGWLISPDFSSNNTLKAIRYAWKFAKNQKIEFRYRQRETITGNDRTRKDLYLRYTVKY